jgi:mono/diheme cytochrome c family protein
MPRLTPIVVLLALVLGLPTAAEAGGKGEFVKVKLKKPGHKLRTGEDSEIKVKIRNRTREERTVEIRVHAAGSDDILAFETVVLDAREKRKLRMTIEIPDDFEGKRFGLRCRAEDAEDDREVKVRPGPGPAVSDEDWETGRDLFLASCASCHGERGKDVRGEDLDDWFEAVLEGEDDMPAFPGFTADQIRLMRAYVESPERGDPLPADEDWLAGREIWMTNCASCHGEKGDEEVLEEDLEDWLEAVREGEDDMPPFPSLSSDDVRLARKYVLDPDRPLPDPDPDPDPDPKPDPDPDPDPKPDPDPVPTYVDSIKSILDSRCVACHRTGTALGGYRMDDYASAFAGRVAIVDSVEKNRMPTSGPLSSADKGKLRAWLDGGAPEK